MEMREMQATMTTRGRVKVYDFGPGSLESVTLRLWQSTTHQRQSGHIMARLMGGYRVYCGTGNDHSVSIDIKADGWLGYALESEDGANVIKAWSGDQEAASDLAHQLIEYALEGWSDPCDA